MAKSVAQKPKRIPANPRAALAALRKADRKLAAAMDKVGPFAIGAKPAGIEAFCRSIIGQQLSVAVAGKIHDRFMTCTNCGEEDLTADHILALRDEDLRAVGLSNAKVGSVKSLAKFWHDQGLSAEKLEHMPDDEIIALMTQVKGIGPWTVKMILMFCLRRADILPVEDLGLKMGLKKIYKLEELPKPKEIEAMAEKWRPWRSIGTWYCWRILAVK
ncbi:hypothetical protein BH09SUM1_BH09SUM1_11830 [soil metagenome]